MRARSTSTYDVVVGLTYYAPYVSGVTEAARVVAEGLAARGHQSLRRLPRRQLDHPVARLSEEGIVASGPTACCERRCYHERERQS